MAICEFCLQFTDQHECYLGRNLPKTMSCPVFEPGIEKFCANPGEFAGAGQIVQMATYFGVKGRELKKVRAMAATEETRLKGTQ